MKVTAEELTRIIAESFRLVDQGRFSSENYRNVLQETVSMWIDPDTDKQIDDRAERIVLSIIVTGRGKNSTWKP